ncbi:unnamed protein product [Paramecium sonneborni]|uniref:Transmembrane protein n=1 Tax=Paramecium sonneborni TaxID=65129 RepID=A0A8S1RBG4_9CILI|nr:unnamed protein product [Paramecium sonneborni]
MQVLCHYSIPQFYTTTNIISLIYISIKNSNLQFDWLTLTLQILQFLISLILMVLIFIRHKYQIRKPLLIALAISFCAISIILLIQQFDYYYLMLIIFQQLALCLLMSLLILNKNLIGFGIVIQIYMIGFLIDFLSFDIWIFKDQFSLNRSIAIMGFGAVGLIIFVLCMLSRLKPEGKLKQELHIIVGFYIFCELFICCNIITEMINNVCNIYLIDLILLKISNVFLDILIFPFAKYNVPKMQISKSQISSEIIENYNTKNLECNVIATKESESELNSALKIRSDKHIVVLRQEQNATNKWIQSLLEIY